MNINRISSFQDLANDCIKEFVTSNNGTTEIRKVLLANNGMAAVKAIRSIRKWSYEQFSSNQIMFICMATPEDMQMNAEYIRMADQIIEIPGQASHNNYSNIDLIVDLAERSLVDAVYVGWGFASENPVLADRLSQVGIKFIGPPADAMRALGDKIASTIVAQSALVPCVNWSGKGLTTDSNIVPESLYLEACCGPEDGLAHAIRIGFPVMVKASEGGGGKGIRLVYNEQEFLSSFTQVQREVPGSPIFVMQVVEDARHLEVQLLADQYGNAIALFGRDCSVQRRHQKIIEEAPVTIAPPEVLRQMEQSAVNLAKLVGYTSAGTVEYLYEPSTKKYYFLELNPRLQVEHPTTEMVSGVNIPAAQLQIAMGIPLSNIKDIRMLYGLTPNGTTPIDFEFLNPNSEQIQIRPSAKGHVIAARITAENPEAGFKPNSGLLMELNFKSNSNVWGYFSVNSAGGVHEYADSQFGHLFAYGSTREEARKSLVMALKEVSIRGDFRNTVEYLVKLLETEVFARNTFTTSWLDKLIASSDTLLRDTNDLQAAVCGGFARAFIKFQSNQQQYLSMLEKGKIPPQECLQTQFHQEFILNQVFYKMEITVHSVSNFKLRINESVIDITAKAMSDNGILVLYGGESHVVYVKEDAVGTTLSVDGSTHVLLKENDPSQLRSPSPGKLVRYLVKDSSYLKAGSAYAEVEVMKMYMPLVTEHSGVFTHILPPNSVLSTGDLIGVLQLDDPNSVTKALPFAGGINLIGPNEKLLKPHHILRAARAHIDSIMHGFEAVSAISGLVAKYIQASVNPTLPNHEFREILGSISARIPAKLSEYLYANTLGEGLDCEALKVKIEEAIAKLPLDDQDSMYIIVAPLLEKLDFYKEGVFKRSQKSIRDLLKNYYKLEALFQSQQSARILLRLREEYKTDLEPVIDIARAISKPETRSELILAFLDYVGEPNEATMKIFGPVLKDLSSLDSKNASKIAYRAREILNRARLPSFAKRQEIILNVFKKVVKNAGTRTFFDFSQLAKLVSSRYSILDIIPNLFYHPDPSTRAVATYAYLTRTNQAYTITSFEHHFHENSVTLSWEFDLLEQSFINPHTNPDASLLFDVAPSRKVRKGVLFACERLEDVVPQVKRLEKMLPELGFPEDDESRQNFSCYATVALKPIDKLAGKDEEVVEVLQEFTLKHLEFYKSNNLMRVTFMILREQQHPRYFTFKSSNHFLEDPVIRHIDPFMTYRLELERMANFDVQSCSVEAKGLRIYHAVGKQNPSDVRFFVRGIIHPTSVASFHDFIISEGIRITTDIMDVLDLLTISYPNTDCNHVLLHFIPVFSFTYEQAYGYVDMLIRRNLTRLIKLRITEVEICYTGYHPETSKVVPFRLIVDIKSQFVVEISAYAQEKNANGDLTLVSLSGKHEPAHGLSVYRLHEPKQPIQPKRYKAHLMGTTYVYDFPALFREALRQKWNELGLNIPTELMECTELILNSRGELEETNRPHGYFFINEGSNTCGMVVFKMKIWTPEYQSGRWIIVIGNDITFMTGSFGPKEDLTFLRGSQLARKLGLPRIYLSANSGARIGMADEVMSKFKIAWQCDTDPQKGFDYLYLSEEDYNLLNANESKPSVTAELILVGNEKRYRLTSIIGQQDGLGVENLQGSGQIAGETSEAYRDIFTITLVTCRSVGIGAYLVRLGQRVIQVEYAPIILTGAGALNKVLGRQVYASNLQLGGPRIMHTNGVSHLTVQNDFEGVVEILSWLSYIPEKRNAPLPIVRPIDPIDREVNIDIPSGAYDPRLLLEGDRTGTGWNSGFFDRGTFKETLGGWAKGVVVGRARLGGIPIGCISVDTRSTESIVWADPAIDSSQEESIKEAGQVWYPNSAFKTAQAIRDFNNGEQLPLMIFANWRGFSGGQSDMSKEVLKFGAYIVDALRDYKQPIFVYVVGELRGGAWVVVDPTINPEMMEMYTFENARGGVLEPAGIIEIKYRTPKIVSTIARLDVQCQDWVQELKSDNLTLHEKEEIKAKISAREKELMSIYSQVAVELADLHDRPQRMLEKNVISNVVEWKKSRSFFYWALLKRIRENEIIFRLQESDSTLTFAAAKEMLKEWYMTDRKVEYEDNQAIVAWFNTQEPVISGKILSLKEQALQKKIIELGKQSTSAMIGSLKSILLELKPDEKQLFLSYLSSL